MQIGAKTPTGGYHIVPSSMPVSATNVFPAPLGRRDKAARCQRPSGQMEHGINRATTLQVVGWCSVKLYSMAAMSLRPTDYLRAEIEACVASLGYYDGTTYHKEKDTLESVKDLIRYLRRDGEDHEVRRHIGSLAVTKTDLIPMFADHWKNEELSDVIIRLLVNLTNPPLLLYEEALPEKKLGRHVYLELLSQIQANKAAFVHEKVWIALAEKLGKILKAESRSEAASLTVERILILVRNVLHVPADPKEEGRADDDASIHDQLRGEAAKSRDNAELARIRERDRAEKEARDKRIASSRHSRFAGTYTIQGMKSLSDRDLISHKAVFSAKDVTLSSNKKPRKTPKNRLPPTEKDPSHRSAMAVRLFLREFCVELLNGAYNGLMHSVHASLQRAHPDSHDETFYFWAIAFFMEFNRAFKFRVELVSETTSVTTFHFIATHCDKYLAAVTVEKRKALAHVRRLHSALKAYKELLRTLAAMKASPDETVRGSLAVILSNVFYMDEYRNLPLELFHRLKPIYMNRGYIRDLVEIVHVFLKLLEEFSKGSRGLVIQQKKKAVRKKKLNAQSNRGRSGPMDETAKEALWEDIKDELKSSLADASTTETEDAELIPFDPAEHSDEQSQKVECLRRIRASLQDKMTSEAAILFRKSRRLFPDDAFGSENVPVEEELEALKDILMASLPEEPQGEVEEERDKEEEADESEEEDRTAAVERVFDFQEFLVKFTEPRILSCYGLLLKSFDSNSNQTNVALVKLFHRLAWDLKCPALFYQASIFRSFQRILASPKKLTDPAIKELARFATFIVRKFTENAATNVHIFMELFFWKRARDAFEVENGYRPYVPPNKSGRGAWTQEEQDELVRAFHEYRSTEDVLERVFEVFEGRGKKYRQVRSKLESLGLIEKRVRQPRAPSAVWSEEEEAKLRELVEQFRSAVDPVSRILEGLPLRRSKRSVLEKCVELGLIREKRELSRRKRREEEEGSEEEEVTVVEREETEVGGELNSALKELYQKEGMRGVLGWLATSLTHVIEDREEDDEVIPVPLVPVTDSHAEAFQSERFLEILRML
ncbi:unnamed protein product, partial [Cyprideis torosa]